MSSDEVTRSVFGIAALCQTPFRVLILSQSPQSLLSGFKVVARNSTGEHSHSQTSSSTAPSSLIFSSRARNSVPPPSRQRKPGGKSSHGSLWASASRTASRPSLLRRSFQSSHFPFALGRAGG